MARTLGSRSAATRTLPARTQVTRFLTYDQATISFYQRVIAAGTTITAAELAAADTFVKAAKAHGYWDRIDECGLYIGAGLTAAALKFKNAPGNPSTVDLRNFVSADYTSLGLKGGGANSGKVGDARYDVRRLPIPDVHLCVYANVACSNTNGCDIGMQVSTNANVLELGCIANNAQYKYASNSNGGIVNTLQTGPGCFIGSGADASAVFYKNGTNIGCLTSGTRITCGQATIGLFTFARGTGLITNFSESDARHCFWSIGRSLTTQNIADFTTDLTALQTTLARA